MKIGKIVYYVIVNKEDLKLTEDNYTDTCKARIVLKKMLDYLDLEFPEITISKNGKPYFKNSNIYFNYSHSKTYIACAVSNYEVGIDIEDTNRIINNEVASKYLDGETDNNKRIEKWVKKESYSKLKRLGLLIQFQTTKLENVKSKNLFINSNDYMCSIYCDCNNVVFKRLFL